MQRDDADREIPRRESVHSRRPCFSAPMFHRAGPARLDKIPSPFALDRALLKCGRAASQLEKFRIEGSSTRARDLPASAQKPPRKQPAPRRTKNAGFPSADAPAHVPPLAGPSRISATRIRI